jgi:hypothetical protein
MPRITQEAGNSTFIKTIMVFAVYTVDLQLQRAEFTAYDMDLWPHKKNLRYGLDDFIKFKR